MGLWTWLVALLSIGIVALVYMIMNQILYSDSGIYLIVNNSFNDTALNVTQQVQTMDRVKTIIDYWPLIAIFAILVWMFSRSQKEEFERGFYT